ARLAHSVKKILKAKYKVGLQHYHPVSTKNLAQDLNRISDTLLFEEVMENAVTVAQNNEQLVPIRNLDEQKIAYVPMGDGNYKSFYNTLTKYTDVDIIQSKNLGDLMSSLKPYNLVIIGHHRSTENPWKAANFTDQEKTWIYEIAREKRLILDVFVKPYALLDLQSIENIETI